MVNGAGGMDGKALADAVRVERRGAVLLLILAQRPVNALTQPLRATLSAALRAVADSDLRAVVICSDLAAFSAGADMSELGKPAAAPGLRALCTQIEDFPKPVIVALNGSTLGAGLELALAAHGRVASPAAHLGLPEIGLGVVPEAGATQRLPRLVGASAALKLMLEPAPISAAQALTIGLVDQVFEGDLRAQACAFAERLAEALQGRAPLKTSDRRDGLRDGKAFQAAIAAARARYAGTPLPAPARLIDCVEACQLLPWEQGLAFEATAREALINTPQAQGLRHAYFAERRAIFPPAPLADFGAAKLGSFAVWGAAEPAADLVAQALAAGLRVTLVEPSREILVAALQKIASRQEAAVGEGRLTPEARDADWARLSTASDAIGGVDLVLKNADTPPPPLEADIPVIELGALPARAAGTRVGLSVAAAAGLVAELAAGAEALVAVQALGLALGRRLGWKLLFTGPGGPIDRRLRAALSAAISQLEAEGLARPIIAAALGSFGIGVSGRGPLPAAPPEAKRVLDACLAALANQAARLISEGVARRPLDVDAAAVLHGMFPRWQGGPLFQADKRGLLVLRADLKRRAEAAPQIYAPDPLFDRLIADGRDFATLNRAD
ncbi:MAG: enoyl-CoA hydratase-related protein [Cypionkella sp.]|uniref:enoyl-CoA hydratase/isomerase family protein n=1 Tax=Cypionkella sp. TaxID=2811411 RepID=UPI002AB83E65|nr:enoyl-CoA hydratase-related protein [Cypionkella sp.]MDZ4309613.1 enoyl-CoA hydratase-related protein [Cypionkella sp.]